MPPSRRAKPRPAAGGVVAGQKGGDSSPNTLPKPIAVTFLVYDSRSGSTLLARHIAERFDHIAVTPELAFDSILRRTGLRSRPTPTSMVRTLIRSWGIRNLPSKVRRAIIKDARMTPDAGPAVIIDVVLRNWLSVTRNDVPIQHVIVKGGTHTRYWRQLRRAYGGTARLIYVIRDPRAAIDSKLRTPRPYAPHEPMAWGGALLAAIRWRRYAQAIRAARRHGLAVLEIKYEDFISNPEGVLTQIGDFVGVATSANSSRGSYTIPRAEQSIHLLATVSVIDRERENLWRARLSSRDRKVIEAVCQSQMRSIGYEPIEHPGKIASWLLCMRAVPIAVRGVIRHFTLTRAKLRKSTLTG